MNENIVVKNRLLDYQALFILLFAVIIGGLVRFFPIVLSNFPLNDGGLFFRMAQDILDHSFHLPVYVFYNGNEIPFGYPPFAFYLMAFLQRFFHFGIIDQLHYLPALISTLTIPVFFYLSERITGSRVLSVFAVFAYALIPNSFIWLVMGGGITRSLGILFGILSLFFAWGMFTKYDYKDLILTILFSSLTVLSHPEVAWFIFITTLLIVLRSGLNKKGILFAALCVIGILLITSPWWLLIIRRFSPALFINAFRAEGSLDLSLLIFNFSGEPFSTILAVVALIGIFAEIYHRRFFLFSWLIIIALFSPRSGQWLATIPTAMLFGAGLIWVFLPSLRRNITIVQSNSIHLSDLFVERISKIALVFLLIYALIGALIIPFWAGTKLYSIANYDRQAMEWISNNTPADSQYVILTGGEWPTDYVSEWFPALSGRVSVSTVQGSEWIPDEQFRKNVAAYEALQACALVDYACISAWEQENTIPYSYLYVRKSLIDNQGGVNPLANASAPPDQFQLVYENSGVMLYIRN